MFAADLVRRIHAPARLSFVKFASYAGTDSSGHVQELIGLTEDLAGKRVVIVEDIIDTGRTISHLLHSLRNRQPADIKIATLFYKPDSLQVPLHIDYFGFQIPNDFIVGYGMDYNGLGRNLPDIYTHVKSLIP
jgi:hypoxanthine phosphoribosyltransferase